MVSALIQSQRPENWRATSVSPRAQRPGNQELWCLKASYMDVQAQERKREFIYPPPFCPFHALNGSGDAHPQWWGPVFLTQSMESNANLFQKHPHRHTPECFTSYLGISQLTHKINHYMSFLISLWKYSYPPMTALLHFFSPKILVGSCLEKDRTKNHLLVVFLKM